MIIYIYRIICGTTKKKYNGQSKNPDKRIERHFWSALKGSNNNIKLYRSIRKYGVENHTWKVIDKCFNKREANKKEIERIAKDDSFHHGLNCTKGGDGGDTYTGNPKLKSILKKLSEASSGGRNAMHHTRISAEKRKKININIQNAIGHGKEHSNYRRDFTDRKREKAISLSKQGWTLQSLAKKYDVSYKLIWTITHGRRKEQ